MPLQLIILVSSGIALGTWMAFSFHNWLFAWMGLEISAISIIPLLSHQNQPRMLECSTKYFINQAAGTAVLIAGTLLNAHYSGNWGVFVFDPRASAMITLALALKLGMVPLHTWFVEAMQGASLYTVIVLATVQKLAPLALILQLNHQFSLLMTLSACSVLVSGLAAMNQTQLRKILAYSSISHMAWVIAIAHIHPPLAVLTLKMYIVLTTGTILILAYLSVGTINAMAMASAKHPGVTAILPLFLLSLAGLPPLTGFVPKMLIIKDLVASSFPLPIIALLAGSLLSLSFYLRLTYSVAATMPPSNTLANAAWFPTDPPYKSMPKLFVVACLALPLTPALMAIVEYLLSR